ncbi:MAG TPA: AAA family ATPase, partial [Euzebya sp.]|nr:AAA family ATPase [Euzebya sp.]
RLTDHRLVGRDEEMRLLVHALDRGVDRKPATVFISGDAGIGKTRLVTELAAVARDRGARLAHGDCIELGSDGLPYAPFVAIVRSLVSDLGVAEVLELAGPDAGELARLAPALDPSSEGTAEATSWGQARLSLAVVSLLEGLARRIPLVVILEDLHWADDSTRGLLPLVVRALLPARAVVALTYRSEDLAAGHPTRRLLAELARRPGSVRMELGPLRSGRAGAAAVPPARRPTDARAPRRHLRPGRGQSLLR